MKERHKALFIILVSFIAGVLISAFLYRIKPQNNTSIFAERKKLVSLAPNVTEIIFALGKGSELAGRSDFCIFPDAALAIPTIGNNFTVSYEKILKLQPGILLNQGENQRLKQFCKNNGIRYLGVNMDSVVTIFSGIEKVGKALQAEQKAEALIARIKNELKKIEMKAGNAGKKRVLVIINRRTDALSGIFTVGRKSFISELIKISGGINIFDDISLNYSEVSIESVIKRNPEIIIEISLNEKFTPANERERFIQWQVHPVISAVKNRKVFFISDDYVLVPGPRIGQIGQLFYKLINGQGRFGND